MKWLIKPAALLLGIAAIGGPAWGQESYTLFGETKDRLPPERMEALVEGPMSVVRKSGLAKGRTAFDQLLAKTGKRHGQNSVEAADLLTSFGVQLYIEGAASEDDSIRAAAIDYLKPAIAAVRTALGAKHPEVAVAIQTYVDAEMNIHGENPPTELSSLLDEAYRIRVEALGPNNKETLAVLKDQAWLEGLPSRVQQEPARLARSADMFERLIARSPNDPAARDMSVPRLRFLLARMYARNSDGKNAVAQALKAVEQMESWPTEDRCVASNIQLTEVAQDLRAAGQSAAADQLPANDGLLGLLSCAMESDPEEPSETGSAAA